MKLIFSLILFVFSTAALAYIPPYWMILSKTADQHGKGPIFVEQEVTFKHGETPQVVTERWMIESENKMRLEVIGKNQLGSSIRMTYVYENGRRYFVDLNGVRKAEKTSADLHEPYFHFRVSKNIKPVFVEQQIAPSESLKSQAHRFSEKNPIHATEKYVRLSRSGGAVNYHVFSKTSSTPTELNPGLWIEQDQFVIRKLRLKSGATIAADNYQSYGPSLLLPKTRTISWNTNSVNIETKTVRAVNSKTAKELTSASSLDFGKNPELARILPNDPVLVEFYSRLR